MRRVLDGIYAGALWVACLAMVTIAALVLAQILMRLLDRMILLAGATPFGLSIPSLSDFGGFLFVAAASLALPATLRSGGHVRVSLLLNIGGPVAQRGLSLAVLAVAIGLAVFATWHLAAQALDSWQFNSVSFGMVKVPLVWPQAVMTLGFGLLALALVDELVTALAGKPTSFAQAEAARSTDNSTDQSTGGH